MFHVESLFTIISSWCIRWRCWTSLWKVSHYGLTDGRKRSPRRLWTRTGSRRSAQTSTPSLRPSWCWCYWWSTSPYEWPDGENETRHIANSATFNTTVINTYHTDQCKEWVNKDRCEKSTRWDVYKISLLQASVTRNEKLHKLLVLEK